MIQTDVVKKGESDDYYRGYLDGKRDAVRRHGEWICADEHLSLPPCLDVEKVGYRCSVCNSFVIQATFYCPHCGAKMDGNENKDDEEVH